MLSCGNEQAAAGIVNIKLSHIYIGTIIQTILHLGKSKSTGKTCCQAC